MSSRNSILEAIRKNRPEPAPEPEIPRFESRRPDLVDAFVEALESAAGRAIQIDGDQSVADAIGQAYPDVRLTGSLVSEAPGNVDLNAVVDPHQLDGVDLFVCKAELGVAENGAVWIPESLMGHRAALFLAQHVAVVLDRKTIVADMHAAYDRIRIDVDGFGLFMAGPSKTADIEQSLVIGAHGPRSLTVVVI